MVFIEFFVEVLKESLGPWKQSRKRFAAFLLSTVEETHNGRHFQLSSKIMRGLFLIKICLIWIREMDQCANTSDLLVEHDKI